MDTANVLKSLRLRMGLTQDEFAKLVGVHQPHVSRSEKPGYVCDIAYLKRVSEKTGKKLIMHYGR